MTPIVIASITLILAKALTSAACAADLPLVPAPAQLEILTGPPGFVVGPNVRVTATTDSLRSVADLLQQQLMKDLATTSGPVGGRWEVKLALDPAMELSLPEPTTTATFPVAPGQEGYRLKIIAEGAIIEAPSPAGAFYGGQTLRQLVAARDAEDALPSLHIEDSPRYAWRGFMLDCSRHFTDKAGILRLLDLLALHKMNVFHWHFIDNNGWRPEVKRLPRLTDFAAWRGPKHDRYGGFYSQEDIREIVAYAAERFITVVPEFEMPGHSTAALAAYPELTCSGKPLKLPGDDESLPNEHLQWFTRHNGAPPFCAGSDAVLEFHSQVFDELLPLFPSKVIHVGGDERTTGTREKCEKCQARMKQKGLADEHDLQNWFMRRISDELNSRGKRAISWGVTRSNPYQPTDMDDLGNNAMVHNWHNGTAFAARKGWDVLNSNNAFVYFDYPEVPGLQKPSWMPLLPLKKVYSFQPTPQELAPEHARNVVGLEACLWTELVPQDVQDQHIWPRLLAVAERAWSPAETSNFAAFESRLSNYKPWLQRKGVKFGPPPASGKSEIVPIEY